MKRELDLIREILLQVESRESVQGWFIPMVNDFTANQIAYHIKLLTEAGYVESQDLRSKDDYTFGIKQLTWAGHEFLDASRDKTIWKKVKSSLGPKINSITFEMFKSLLIDTAKREFGLD